MDEQITNLTNETRENYIKAESTIKINKENDKHYRTLENHALQNSESLSKTIKVLEKTNREGKLQISQLTKKLETATLATKGLGKNLLTSNLQNIQLDQKLKETEKVKSEAEEQVTTSKSRIEVFLEDLNVTKTETAQVIESKSQEIDTLLEKREEYDGV